MSSTPPQDLRPFMAALEGLAVDLDAQARAERDAPTKMVLRRLAERVDKLLQFVVAADKAIESRQALYEGQHEPPPEAFAG